MSTYHVNIRVHSRLSKDLIKSQPPWMGPSQDEGSLLRGPEYGFRKILANGAAKISMNLYYERLYNALSPCESPIFFTKILISPLWVYCTWNWFDYPILSFCESPLCKELQDLFAARLKGQFLKLLLFGSRRKIY